MNLRSGPASWDELAQWLVIFYAASLDELRTVYEENNEEQFAQIKKVALRVCIDVAWWHLQDDLTEDDEQTSRQIIRPISDTLMMIVATPLANLTDMPLVDVDNLMAILDADKTTE